MTQGTFIFILFAFITSLPLLGHKGKRHGSDNSKEKISQTKAARPTQELKQINDWYVKEIEPIFKSKCFDCHAVAKKLPWYSEIPGPKHLIRRDIREAKKHMDMTNDFPFAGHGTPLEDMDAL